MQVFLECFWLLCCSRKLKGFSLNKTGFLVKLCYMKHLWMTTNELSIRHILRSMLHKKKARYLVVCCFEQMRQSFWTVQDQKYAWNRDITEKSHLFPVKIVISLFRRHILPGHATVWMKVSLLCAVKWRTIRRNKRISVLVHCTAPYPARVLCPSLLDTHRVRGKLSCFSWTQQAVW